MKFKGVFLAAILTVVLCICGNLLAYSGGTGEPNSPYKIANVPDFQQLTIDPNNWNKSFILTADVNLAGVTLTPVGNSSTQFTGVFDGNDNIISNAVINQPSINNVGLFGYVGSGGQIRNLGVKNVNITGSSYVGGLVGLNVEGTVTSCYATGSVSGTNNDVGGLVGANGSGTLTSCYATGSVTGSFLAVGGLAGRNGDGTLTGCYATGSVSGFSDVGGLVGWNVGGTATTCYATGLVNGTRSNVGGLVGRNEDGTVTSCYATGSVSETAFDVGGLVGYKTGGGSISGSYFLITSGPDNGYGTPLTDAQMKQQSNFVGWDFVGETANGTNDIWKICNGTNYPKLAWQKPLSGDFACPDGTDFYDLTIFMDQWLLEKLTQDTSPNGGDGIVNFIDWATFADKWQGDMNDIADFASQWLKLSAYCADIAPAPDGDGVVNFVDFAMFAEHWLEGAAGSR